MIYKIPHENFEKFEKKINKLIAKGEKYGCLVSYTYIREKFEMIGVMPNRKLIHFHEVDVNGIAKIGNWQLIAKIEHIGDGNIVIPFFDMDVPARYHSADPICEHCNSNRKRKYTYLVLDSENNVIRQVGKTCLKDYTGIDLEFATYMEQFEKECRISEDIDWSYGYSSENYIEIDVMLEICTELIRIFGYGKSKDSYGDFNPDSTKERFKRYRMDRLTPAEKEKIDESNFDYEVHSEYVKDMIAWQLGKDLESEEYNNSFNRNVSLLLKNEYVPTKYIGYLCPLPYMYQKHLEYVEREKANKELAETSKHFGNVGDKVAFDIASIKPVTSYETMFGITVIYKITDADGHEFIWKTSSSVDYENVVSIKGTIKAHNEYNGVKQTELTRCRCTTKK